MITNRKMPLRIQEPILDLLLVFLLESKWHFFTSLLLRLLIPFLPFTFPPSYSFHLNLHRNIINSLWPSFFEQPFSPYYLHPGFLSKETFTFFYTQENYKQLSSGPTSQTTTYKFSFHLDDEFSFAFVFSV